MYVHPCRPRAAMSPIWKAFCGWKGCSRVWIPGITVTVMFNHFGSQLRRVYFQLGSDLLWLCLAPRPRTGLLCWDLYMYLTQSHPSCLLHISLSALQQPCILQTFIESGEKCTIIFYAVTPSEVGGKKCPAKATLRPKSDYLVWIMGNIDVKSHHLFWIWACDPASVRLREQKLGCQLNEKLL